MSANVETMFYNREKPWHGLGVKVDHALCSADALRIAQLDWEIEGKPVFTENGTKINGYFANTRSSDGRVMGIVGSRYSIVQNRDAFEFTDNLIGEGITYETAGSLNGGRRIWMLGKMPERYIVGDKVEPYIVFTNTHDGTGAVRVCMTPIRVVCNNTLNAAISGAKRSWSAPHRGDVSAKLEEARQTLELADQYLTKLDEVADRLANTKLSEGEMIKAIDQMIPVTDDMTDRQKKTAESAKEEIIVCTLRPDIAQFLGTKWGFLNAVSDYVGHSEPMRHTKNYEENRWGSIISGHSLFDKACAAVGIND
jgi:phage/plasmid-like protein (TIGR03299 family)